MRVETGDDYYENHSHDEVSSVTADANTGHASNENRTVNQGKDGTVTVTDQNVNMTILTTAVCGENVAKDVGDTNLSGEPAVG